MSNNPLERIKLLARSKGGVLLSTEYLGNHTKHVWQCGEQHVWSTTPAVVQQGSWCIECQGKRQLSLTMMKDYAKKFGGDCLSDSYIKKSSPLLWKCKSGHEWTASFSQIESSGWCRECAGKNIYDKEKKLQAVQLRAKELGGKCISDQYENSLKPMSFSCVHEHRFELSYNKVMSANRWCKVCVDERLNRKWQYSLQEINEVVNEKGGEIKERFGYEPTSVISLRCGQGHEWRSTVSNLVKRKKWCPSCAKYSTGEKLGLEKIKEIALSRGGRCLSESMISRTSSMTFVCKVGHKWDTSAFSLCYSKSWCPSCAIESSKNNLEEKEAWMLKLREGARVRGGECLSPEYSSMGSHYDFKCSKGHTWSSSGRNFLFGKSWCPDCAGKLGETLSIEFVRQITGLNFKKVRPKWLMGLKGKPLELDAYCEDFKLAIEYQGQQHYEFIPSWHKTQEYFQECQARDEIKRQLCAKNGVTLFEIPFIEKPNKERVAAHIESLAAEACLPYAFNPEYRQFLKESAGAGVSLERSESFKAD